MDNENLVYWNGKPVGMEAYGRIVFFIDAPQEALEAMS